MTIRGVRLACRVVAAAALAALAPGLAVAAPDAGPMATIKAFLADFDKGDIAAAQATNMADVSIVDEVPPHAWRGPGAFQAWLGDLTKDSAAHDQTDEKVTFVRAIRSQADGDSGYAVAEVQYTYRLHGRRMVEPARIAASLVNIGGTWQINSWAWTGGVPHAVAAAKPAAVAPAAAVKPKG